MRRFGRTVGLALVVALSGGHPAATAGESIFGFWLTENGKAIIEIRPCGTSVCGQTAWLQKPALPSGQPKRDDQNPDPSLRARTLCGLGLLRGRLESKSGPYRGAIYSPRHGRTFNAEFRALGPDTLEVRGFVGLSIFGSSQNWIRVGTDRGGC